MQTAYHVPELNRWLPPAIKVLGAQPSSPRLCDSVTQSKRTRFSIQTGGNNAVGDAPIAAELVRPRIIKDRTARAWLPAHSGRAEFAPLLDGYSQSSAKFVILLPESRHSFYAAFFKDNSIPHGAAPPTIHDTVTRSFEPQHSRKSALRDFKCLRLPRAPSSSNDVGGFGACGALAHTSGYDFRKGQEQNRPHRSSE